MNKPYETEAQDKNLAWYLPRPNSNKYPGGMPLHCESWLISLAENILGEKIIEENIFHPFAGGAINGVKMDIQKTEYNDIKGDAHDIPIKDNTFKLAICDPPYSDEEAEEIYETPSLNYSKWSDEVLRVTKDGGIVMMYHKKLLPNPNPDICSLVKQVFIANRTWHLPRVCRCYKVKK